MKKSSSLLAAALQLLACASLMPNTGAAKVDTTDSSQATISERVARVRTAMVEQTKQDTEQGGAQLTGWATGIMAGGIGVTVGVKVVGVMAAAAGVSGVKVAGRSGVTTRPLE